MLRKIHIVAPTHAGNALGRALALAELAAQHFDVEVFAWNDGPLWDGAAQWSVAVTPLTAGALERVEAWPEASMLWAVKPVPRTLRAVAMLDRALPRRSPASRSLVIDFDDDDAGLAEIFQRSSAANRLRLIRRRHLRPNAIHGAQTRLLAAADGVTYASYALRDCFVSRGVALPRSQCRIPHPRPDSPVAPPTKAPDARVRLGFMGTVRPHKGFEVIERLVLGSDNYELHMFQGQLNAVRRNRLGTKLVEHRPDTPLSAAYSEVDVALVPQSPVGAAGVQLPAKLLDGLRAGVPTIAADTPAIRELAAESVLYLRDWEDMVALRAEIHRAANMRARLSSLARARYEAVASPASLGRAFADFISNLEGELATTVAGQAVRV